MSDGETSAVLFRVEHWKCGGSPAQLHRRPHREANWWLQDTTAYVYVPAHVERQRNRVGMPAGSPRKYWGLHP